MTPGFKLIRRSINFPGRFSRFILRLSGNRPPAQICVTVLGINVLFIAVALLLPPAREFPTYYFQGTRLISFVSFVQLVVISALAFQVYRERLDHPEEPSDNSRRPQSRHLWLVMCLGFSFLAVDEMAAIHVYLDRAINVLASGNGRIHSVTISFYAVGALGVLLYFRQELVTFRRSWLPFVAAFFCLVLAIAFDSMAIYKFEPLFLGFSEVLLSSSGRGVTEEALELFSEGFFIIAMYTSVVEARRIGSKLLAGSNEGHNCHSGQLEN